MSAFDLIRNGIKEMKATEGEIGDKQFNIKLGEARRGKLKDVAHELSGSDLAVSAADVIRYAVDVLLKSVEVDN